MTTTLDARNLTLQDVNRYFKLKEQFNDSITSLLPLESLTEFEQQELWKIRDLFRSYYAAGKIAEGQIKFLFIAPLMNLAGFYQANIQITLEENIAEIAIEDENTNIKGRMDILAVNKSGGETRNKLFWLLLIESKNSSVNAWEGLPQLISYAYRSLENQTSVWGLTTNGMDYQFIYIQQGSPPIYQILPKLDITRQESAIELLQILKSICRLWFD
ncbi:restriction endonuclease subunit R [Chrysosporum bergii ANA360D]|uniref:Restriction endonuclease subunit R n=1 Tax=Chrysosporum bergii ANA360D TaxID=617107 RepID=A0AA43KCK4_9CYAN|nr:restriction endonuclease subunit R [Chrysosporum bergii]MDH6061572.1 restriction endonuclease subunit R [Chrysosporum bergii ANA360D]